MQEKQVMMVVFGVVSLLILSSFAYSPKIITINKLPCIAN